MPPFGYDFDPKTQRLKINKEEAKVVRMVFEWLVYDGLMVYQIQKRLKEVKIPMKFDRVGREKKNGKCWWQPLYLQNVPLNSTLFQLPVDQQIISEII